MLVTCLKRVGFFFRKGNVTSRREPATLISWSLPRQRDVTPYRSPGCADVLRGARADVTDFSYMTLMDKSVVKHNMLKPLLMPKFCWTVLVICCVLYGMQVFIGNIYTDVICLTDVFDDIRYKTRNSSISRTKR